MKIINLLIKKMEKGIAPVGKWSVLDKNTGKIVDSGLLYNRETYWSDEPKPRKGGN